MKRLCVSVRHCDADGPLGAAERAPTFCSSSPTMLRRSWGKRTAATGSRLRTSTAWRGKGSHLKTPMCPRRNALPNAAILTGRNPWQLEAAGNHQCFFPAKFLAFGDALRKAGVYGGSAGKLWGPGIAEDASRTKT